MYSRKAWQKNWFVVIVHHNFVNMFTSKDKVGPLEPMAAWALLIMEHLNEPC